MKEYGIMEFLLLTKNRCGRRTGNRKFIWSGLNVLAIGKRNHKITLDSYYFKVKKKVFPTTEYLIKRGLYTLAMSHYFSLIFLALII